MVKNKDKPTVDVFLVRRGDVTIRRVQAVDISFRHVTIRCKGGHRRERKMSLYHRYYEDFQMAKHWLRTELEITLTKTKNACAHIEKLLDNVNALTELDL